MIRSFVYISPVQIQVSQCTSLATWLFCLLSWAVEWFLARFPFFIVDARWPQEVHVDTDHTWWRDRWNQIQSFNFPVSWPQGSWWVPLFLVFLLGRDPPTWFCCCFCEWWEWSSVFLFPGICFWVFFLCFHSNHYVFSFKYNNQLQHTFPYLLKQQHKAMISVWYKSLHNWVTTSTNVYHDK